MRKRRPRDASCLLSPVLSTQPDPQAPRLTRLLPARALAFCKLSQQHFHADVLYVLLKLLVNLGRGGGACHRARPGASCSPPPSCPSPGPTHLPDLHVGVLHRVGVRAQQGLHVPEVGLLHGLEVLRQQGRGKQKGGGGQELPRDSA